MLPNNTTCHTTPAFLAELAQIIPLDDQERLDIARGQDIARSGASVCRSSSPNIPDPHLVSYFPSIDFVRNAHLLGRHRKSGLWLPAGGHVDVDEHPRTTVRRECMEELRLEATFWQSAPVFFTITKTVGLQQHEDMSLWYVLNGDASAIPDFDHSEWLSMKWFPAADSPQSETDPNLARFAAKLIAMKVAS